MSDTAMVSTPLAATSPAPAAERTLRGRMWRAGMWLLGSHVSSQLMRLVSNLLLTRLLAPEAFGLIAAVNTLYFGLVMFSDLGVWQSVVKDPRGEDPRFLATAWAVQLLRSVGLALGVAGIALGLHLAARAHWFPAHSVMNDPRLPWMVLAGAFCALLQGAESMKLAVAQRQLRGRELARLELLTQAVAALVSIGLAVWTASVWALMAGTVAAAATRSLLSHCALTGPSVRPGWSADHARQIMGFGKWIVASSIVGFLAAHGEKLLLGGTLSSSGFGVFVIASLLAGAVSALYGSLNGHVVFSSLSLARHAGTEALQRVYERSLAVADALLGSLAGVLVMAGHWPVLLLYDARYHEAGWMLRVLGLGLVALRHQVTEQLMFACDRPDRVTGSNLLRALALLLTIPIGYRIGGDAGAVVAVVLSQFAGWPNALHFKRQMGCLQGAAEWGWLRWLGVGAALGWMVDAALLRLAAL